MEITGKKEVTLLTEDQINLRLKELAEEVADYYLERGIKNIILTIVLNGGLVLGGRFLQMLFERGLEVQQDTVQVSSYGLATTSSRKPEVTKKPSLNWDGQHVLIFEDMIHTGWSMDVLLKLVNGDYEAMASLALSTFLVKEGVAEVEVPVDFRAFVLYGDSRVDSGDVWVDGVGIDTKEDNRGKRDLDAIIDQDKEAEVTVSGDAIIFRYLLGEVA